jgi:hypothetical protein
MLELFAFRSTVTKQHVNLGSLKKRLANLSCLVSPRFNLPLVHKTYIACGNLSESYGAVR